MGKLERKIKGARIMIIFYLIVALVLIMGASFYFANFLKETGEIALKSGITSILLFLLGFTIIMLSVLLKIFKMLIVLGK